MKDKFTKQINEWINAAIGAFTLLGVAFSLAFVVGIAIEIVSKIFGV